MDRTPGARLSIGYRHALPPPLAGGGGARSAGGVGGYIAHYEMDFHRHPEGEDVIGGRYDYKFRRQQPLVGLLSSTHAKESYS